MLAACVAVLWLASLPARPLFNTDEGRYAEIPREMLAGGDWIVPHLNGVPYVEKPPLQYWATAVSLGIFGDGEFGARLYTGLCALGTLGVVWVMAARLWGREVARRSSAVLVSMMLFVVMGQLLTLDMSLTFYMTLGLAAFLLAQPRVSPGDGAEGAHARAREGGEVVVGHEPRADGARAGDEDRAVAAGLAAELTSADRQERPAGQPVAARYWMLTAWMAIALGVLTKGLEAAAIPAAVLVVYSVYARDFSPWRRLQWGWGLPLFLVVTVPWHWLAARRLPDFLEFFFVHEHLARYLTPSADREEVWWFFAAVFVLGTIPWTGSALRVVLLTWRRRRVRGQFDAVAFLWLWVVFIGVFFSLSDSKLIPYLLPVVPAVALLIGASTTDQLRRDAALTAVVTLAAGLALVAAGILGPRFVAVTERNGYFLQLAGPLREIGLLLAMGAAFVLLRCRRDLTWAVVLLGAVWCLAGLCLMRAATAVAPIYSGVVLGRALALEQVPADVPIYSVATYDQTVPFYARRTVRLVAYRGELDFGLRHEPDAEIPEVAVFVAQWQGLRDGYAMMETSMFEDLKSRGVPMREIARDVHRVLVARR